MPDAQQLAQQILDSIGGSANIADVENCMTRLRVEVSSPASVDLPALQATDGVMAAIAAGSNLQIVLGPGLVDRVADSLEGLRSSPTAPAGAPSSLSPEELAARGAAIKASARSRSDGRTMRAIRKISAIFIPLIPALIACGLIAGINGILTNLGWVPGVTPFLGVLSSGFLSLLAVFVGMAVLSKSVSRWSSAARPSSVVPSAASSSRPVNGPGAALLGDCTSADVRLISFHAHPLENSLNLPTLISLFSGAGGLDLGFQQAGFEVAFASDNEPAAIESHRKNFPHTVAMAADIKDLTGSAISAALGTKLPAGSRIGIIGGPPCQGFSRANTRSIASDPRNLLPQVYLRVVEELQEIYDVEFVLFENVLGIKDKKHEESFQGILSRFEGLGLTSNVTTYKAELYGVPQRRRRVIISAFQSPSAALSFRAIESHTSDTALTVRDAIGGFPEPTYFRPGPSEPNEFHANHWTMVPRSRKFTDGTITSATRSFRLLQWDRPSPTVAYGNREIHVHPSGHRRLSVFEAMQLQGFPADFVLTGTLSAQVQQVSNAVPPPLARALAAATAISLEQSREHENGLTDAK